MFPAPRAAYIHIPFCRHRCGYCNFTVIANRDDLQADYLSALELEITQSLRAPRSLDTLFIGGGTPTALSVEHLRRLCDMLRQWFSLEDRYEWTIEANPADLNLAKLEVLSAAGVNRISLGAQSFQSAKLQRLERDHCGADVERCVREARSRFDSVALDLIFAVPGESVADWQTDLDQAIRLQPDHLSIYGLTIEKGAIFWNRAARGDLIPIGEEQQRAMYELARTVLVEAGWEHYEVSNYACPGHHCRHNTTYWVGDPYFAFGAGAARYFDGWRETNHRSTRNYLQRMTNGHSPVAEREQLNPEQRAREQLVFGLRMLAGVKRTDFQRRTGFSVDELVGEPLREFVRLGLLDDDGERIMLTRDGLLISDALWPEFL